MRRAGCKKPRKPPLPKNDTIANDIWDCPCSGSLSTSPQRKACVCPLTVCAGVTGAWHGETVASCNVLLFVEAGPVFCPSWWSKGEEAEAKRRQGAIHKPKPVYSECQGQNRLTHHGCGCCCCCCLLCAATADQSGGHVSFHQLHCHTRCFMDRRLPVLDKPQPAKVLQVRVC